MELYLNNIGEGLGAFIILETIEYYYYSWMELMYDQNILPIN